ncbi:MAG: holo-ACP synthase [Treponema sp.]|jgi:holo-[acyl-carrier protein] synthase|nr:holo-ACP synthase [Treponema sp.]
MIKGIGIDMVRIPRLDRWRNKPGLLERYFHPEELAALKAKGRGMAASLAARFAAKEAFGKALETGLAGITLKDIRVINRSGGRPDLKLDGSAGRALRQSGAGRAHLSLTHEGDYAVAVVVLEGDL